MITIYVTYSGDAHTRFDREYYVNEHLPLVLKSWGPYGLASVAAFFPAEDGAGTIAVCECKFRDEAALEVAFRSPHTPAVMADVAKISLTCSPRAAARCRCDDQLIGSRGVLLGGTVRRAFRCAICGF